MTTRTTSYTPGPWSLGGELISAGGTIGHPVQEIASVWSRCRDRQDGPSFDTFKANARLIAAAPAMAEALRAIVTECDGWNGSGVRIAGLDAARAALALAGIGGGE